MINDETLIKKGYKEFEVPPFHSWACNFYQKKIKDINGIKYFIECYKTLHNEDDTPSYEFQVYLRTPNDNYTMMLNFYAISDVVGIDTIEKQSETAWLNLNAGYYELFEEK